MNVYRSIIHKAKRWKHPKCLSTDEQQMDKQNVSYPYNGILIGLEKDRITNTCYNTNKPWKYYPK